MGLPLFNRINGDPVGYVGMGQQTAYCEAQIAPDSSAYVIIEAVYVQPLSNLSLSRGSRVRFHTGHNMML